jgi:DNA-directed RNA polymerase specialized sigma24 family protein
VKGVGPKKDWVLTPDAFDHLLQWLDQDTSSSGESYLEMRRRLVAYFDRKHCPAPDELADETLNRVARRLKEEGTITSDPPAHYCYIVARFVLLEFLRKQQPHVSFNEKPLFRQTVPIDEMPDMREAQEEREKRWGCLERCMASMETVSRELIVGYYHGEQRTRIENRRALAVKLGITVNALSIRACRIRGKLEDCIQKCLSGG